MNKLNAGVVVIVLLIQLLLVACPGQTQCVAAYAVIPLEEAIPQATLIVIGTVESVTRRQDQGRFGATPEYAATVLVEETVRGQATAGEPITVRMVCEPHLQQGEHVLLLLVEQAPTVATLVVGPQGVYQLSVHDQRMQALGVSMDGDTSLAHLLDLIAALPPAPTTAATHLPNAVQATATPAAQQSAGEQIFVTLKQVGVTTELILFPKESHGRSVGGRTDRRIA